MDPGFFGGGCDLKKLEKSALLSKATTKIEIWGNQEKTRKIIPVRLVPSVLSCNPPLRDHDNRSMTCVEFFIQ